MKINLKIISIVLFALLGALPFATAISYDVSEAVGDKYGKYAGGHVLWVGGKQWVFDSNGGWFTKTGTTARLFGTLEKKTNPAHKLFLDVNFSGHTNTPPTPDSPKKELKDEAYIDHVPPGPVDPKSWYYYTGIDGTLKRADNTVKAKISERGPAFQVGYGANGKNINLGGSGWLTVKWYKNKGGYKTLNGDFNFDLNKKPVPESGATVAMLGAALGILALAARRRK